MADELIKAVYRKDRTTIIQFLQSGIDINNYDRDGRNALMHAVLDTNGDSNIVQFLVENNIDVNSADRDQKWTALHFAARDNKADMVSALVAVGATVDATDTFGNTPLWRCVMHCGEDCTVVALLLEAGANPDQPNSSGVSPLSLARNMGRSDLVKLMNNRSG